MLHTQTRIYQRSLELVAVARSAINTFPSGHGYLADQLRRAASSVVLNFAEGYGKRTARDRRRYFTIARGSAFEAAAAFDVAHTLDALDPKLHTEAIDLADHIAAMLHRFR